MLNVESSNTNYAVFNCVLQHQNQTNYLPIRLLSQSQTVVKPNESNWLITFNTPYTTSLTAAHDIKKTFKRSTTAGKHLSILRKIFLRPFRIEILSLCKAISFAICLCMKQIAKDMSASKLQRE